MSSTLRDELLCALQQVNFADRYYEFCEKTKERGKKKGCEQSARVAALEATPLPFTYNKREDFFSHEEEEDGLTIGLNVAFTDTSAEFILLLLRGHEKGGAPFTVLARELKEREDPHFSYTPRAPRPRFSTPSDLQEAMGFGVELYQDARNAIVAQLTETPKT